MMLSHVQWWKEKKGQSINLNLPSTLSIRHKDFAMSFKFILEFWFARFLSLNANRLGLDIGCFDMQLVKHFSRASISFLELQTDSIGATDSSVCIWLRFANLKRSSRYYKLGIFNLYAMDQPKRILCVFRCGSNELTHVTIAFEWSTKDFHQVRIRWQRWKMSNDFENEWTA